MRFEALLRPVLRLEAKEKINRAASVRTPITAEAAPQLIAPSVLLALLPLLEILLAPPEAKVPATMFALDDGPPPFGVAVARTVVLLI